MILQTLCARLVHSWNYYKFPETVGFLIEGPQYTTDARKRNIIPARSFTDVNYNCIKQTSDTVVIAVDFHIDTQCNHAVYNNGVPPSSIKCNAFLCKNVCFSMSPLCVKKISQQIRFIEFISSK